MPRDDDAPEAPPDYRKRVAEVADDVTATLQHCARQLRQRAELCTEPGKVPGLDPKFAQAMLNLARTAATLLEATSGLEGLTHDGLGDASSLAGDDAADRLRDALRGRGAPGTA